MITEETTLSELKLELAKMGIIFLSVKQYGKDKYIAGIMSTTSKDWIVSPQAETPAEAIEEAIDLLRHAEAARIAFDRSSHVLDLIKKG